MPYGIGLIQGFQQRRDQEFQRNYEADIRQREAEGKIYEHLMTSRDPEIQALALSGLFESAQQGKRKGGLRGYMGEVQGGQTYPKLLQLINSYMPREEAPGVGGGPIAGGSPGSAAMSTNVPVQQGSTPIQLGGGEVHEFPEDAGGGPGIPSAGAGDPAGTPGLEPPPAPLDATSLTPQAFQNRFKRRGTGIPTAEEIAEATEYNRRQAIDRSLLQTMGTLGMTPDQQRDTFMGSHGNPPSRGSARIGPMVTFEGVDGPQATVLRNGVLFLEDGETPVPPGYKVVATPRAPTGSAGLKRDVVADSSSKTGRTAVYSRPEEGDRVPDVAWTPPPAETGAGTMIGPDGIPVLASRDRGGRVRPGPDAAVFLDPQEAVTAQGVLKAVDARVRDAQRSRLGGVLGMTPQAKDKIVQEESARAGIGYQTYGQLQQAANKAKVPAREAAGGSKRDAVLEDLKKRGKIPNTGGLTPPPLP